VSAVQAATPPPATRVGRFRWLIAWLVFFAVTINFMDRQMLGVLKPLLDKELGWSEAQYADTVFWFQCAYGLSFPLFGRLVDRIGAKWGYSLSFVLWTLAHMAHGAAGGIGQFIAARVALGIGEAGNFPAAIKAISEWFPQRERAFATGLFNAGSNIGAVVTPLIVPIIALAFGWRAAFIITGLGSFLWLVVWLLVYRRPREHSRVGAAELALIESDPPNNTPPMSWRAMLGLRQTWAIAIAKFLIDPIWWMFLFWLPDFFAKTYGLNLKTFGPPLVAIYLMADVGSLAGGWMSSRLIQRGWSVNRARKITMLVMGLLPLPVMIAQGVGNLWGAVLILGLATAGHQGFSANVYTLATDLFPKNAVATALGIGGLLGSAGGMLMAKYAGFVLEKFGSYTPIFVVAGLVYLTALGAVHLLSPRLAQVER
jgi:ACS family hexuronate transporter-like MFS transporter